MAKEKTNPIQSIVDGRVVLIVVGTTTEGGVEAKKHSSESDFKIHVVINTNDPENEVCATYMSWRAPEAIQSTRRVINLTPAETTPQISLASSSPQLGSASSDTAFAQPVQQANLTSLVIPATVSGTSTAVST
jgi:hypothetical protein